MMRDYEYLQQRVFLKVDLLNKRLFGVAEIILAPKASILQVIRLHARQLKVQKVMVNQVETTFEQLDFLGEIVDEAYRDLGTFDLFYRGAIVASKEGELIIQIPKEIDILPISAEEEEEQAKKRQKITKRDEKIAKKMKKKSKNKKKKTKNKRKKRGQDPDRKEEEEEDENDDNEEEDEDEDDEDDDDDDDENNNDDDEEDKDGEDKEDEEEEEEDDDDEDEEEEDDDEDDDDDDEDVLDRWDIEEIPKSTTSFKPLIVRIEYELENPSGGIRFILPNESENPQRFPHMYTYCGPFGGLCDGARTWMPCRDTVRDICTFRVEITVPFWCIAICSGQLVDQIIDHTNKKKNEQNRIFRFVLNTKTNCSSIGFAIGPFRMYVPKEMPRLTHFALTEIFLEEMLFCTNKFNTTSMDFFEKYLLMSYPFQNYQQVFVEDPPEQIQSFAGFSILDQNLLHGPKVIDRELSSHLAQVKAFISSWINGAVGIQTTKDAWVVLGVIGHLMNIYVRAIYGEEEAGYRIQLAMDALVTLELTNDQHSPALLSSEVEVYAEYDPCILPFLEVKAPLILHMIEQRVGPKHLCLAIQRVIHSACGIKRHPRNSHAISTKNKNKNKNTTKEEVKKKKKVVDQKQQQKQEQEAKAEAEAEEEDDDDEEEEEEEDKKEKDKNHVPHGNQKKKNKNSNHQQKEMTPVDTLSTLSFLKTVRQIAGSAGQDLTKSFLTTWILEAGMPFFTVGYWYNRKQTQAEIVVQQEIVPFGNSNSGKLYTGPITVTIVEDTSEYPHTKRIENKRHKWDFPCHSKVRKKRRKRQGLEDADDSVSVNGPGMGLNDTPVFWVKLDTGCSWLRHIVMHQPDFNWMEQLLSDKKVSARVLAARALALYHQPHEKPNVMSVRVLTECMSGLTTHSRRLRAEATLSLGIWQSIHAPLTNANTCLPIWKGMHNLFRIFKEHFFDHTIDMPLPNYFLPSGGKVLLESLGAQQASFSSKKIQVQDYAAGEYEIKKTIPLSLAMIHAQNGTTPIEIEHFLIQLLNQNDNSKNYVEMKDPSQVVEDCFYLGTIIISLSQLEMDRLVVSQSTSANTTSTSTSTNTNTSTTNTNTSTSNTSTNGLDRTMFKSIHPADEKIICEILRYLNYDQVQSSYRKTITVCCLEALCNLILNGRCPSNLVDFFEFAKPKHLNIVRKAAIESIIRLFFGEDPNGPSSCATTTTTTTTTTSSSSSSSTINKKKRQSSSLDDDDDDSSSSSSFLLPPPPLLLYGAPAALKWVSDFLQVEQSPGLRLFAVQVCLNCFRGFPPSVSTEILSTIEHGYILSIRRTIQMRDPLCFLQKNPEKKHIQELFACPSLKKLRSDTQMAKIIVEEIWKKMNTCTAFDQRLRIALMVLYKKIWKESTPIAVAHTVQKKSSNWAGGYESLRLMMEESKLRMNNGGTTTTTTTTTSSSSNHQQGYRSTTGTSGSISSLVTKKEATLNVSTTGNGSSRTNSNVTTPTNIGETTALEKLKGKKIKLKMGGDTLFKSHKI